jgi:EAL and modified HD-GYP domain-containing signal transduction protein
MSDDTILSQVALGYSPMIDRQRAVVATRLTVFPVRPDATIDAGALLAALTEVWPADGATVSLNVASETLLADLLAAAPAPNVMIEVPAFMAGDSANFEALGRLYASGNKLLIKGRPVRELPREVLPFFKYSIVDAADDRRTAEVDASAAALRSIPFVQSGVRTLAALDASFQRGAAAVVGWPIDDAVGSARGDKGTRPDVQAVVELIQRVDKGEDVDRLEATLKRDPTTAFKLLRYINSPAFGLRVEVSSFRHAIMMLGHQKLKRWLALLLATAGQDNNLKPVMYASVRRGMMMEELVRGSSDDEMRGEVFICGVFSLLDKSFGQPFAELLKSLPVPPKVCQALAQGDGPYRPLLDLVQAVEAESLYDMRELSDRLLLGAGEVNRAVLRALKSAATLD